MQKNSRLPFANERLLCFLTPSGKDKRQVVAKLYKDGKMSMIEICQMFEMSKPTLYKYVKAFKEEKEGKSK